MYLNVFILLLYTYKQAYNVLRRPEDVVIVLKDMTDKNYEPSVELCLKLVDAALFIGIYICIYIYVYTSVCLNVYWNICI
jgi:hypothetical protein